MNTLNCRGSILDLRSPIIMGIINVNNDSFYVNSRKNTEQDLIFQAGKMISDGAAILDLGGVSTRPGAKEVDILIEINRVVPAIEAIIQKFPETIISVDTFNSEVAVKAIEAGASIINDISSGNIDSEMPVIAKEYNCPYIMMHMQGNPQNMQHQPHYENVVLEILDYLIEKVGLARSIGLHDVIIDPGFGFGKTISHNYQLLNGLNVFTILDKPLLAGLSRKGMFWKPLNSNAEDVLPATIAANMVALQKGAKILRVHDVDAARQVIKTFELLKNNQPEVL